MTAQYAGSLEKVEWDRYAAYRPGYPPSLEKLIMDYHRAHSNSLRLAHDAGAGSGAFAQRLAEYFQHVHVSDTNPVYVEQARQRLDKSFAQRWWKGRFTFSVTRAEQADEVAAKGSVDLVTLIQCSHWMDQDDMVRSVANSLAPNGTLAIAYYNPAPTIVNNATVDEASRSLFRFWMSNVLEGAGGRESMAWKKYVPQGHSGLESVPLPEDLFIQDVTKRIEINLRGRGKVAHVVPGYEHLVTPSRASPEHRRYEYTSEDPEGQGWRYEVDAGWFRGFIAILEQESQLHLYEQHLQEVEKLVKETSPTGTVVIEWTVALLFATRK